MSRHGAEGERRERHRRVGQGGVEDERQVDRGGQARPERERPGPAPATGRAPRATSAASRQASTGTSAPISTLRDLRRRRTCAPKQRHRDRGEERRQRQPDLERRPREDQRRRLVAPQRVGHEAAALEEVARDADVVGGVLRLREDDLRGEDGRTTSATAKTSRGGQHTPRGGSCAPGTHGEHGQAAAARPSAQHDGSPSHAGRLAVEDGASGVTLSSRSRTSQWMSYARATSSMVSSGSLTSTTPPRPVQYW